MQTWYVRKGGSDNNGGSSPTTTPDRSGTDGSRTNATPNFSAASGAFTSADIGKGINIAGTIYRIVSVTSATAIVVDRNFTATTASLTWAIGGAIATIAKIPNQSAAVLQSGDVVYVGAGVYRETPTFNMTNPTDRTGTDAVVTAGSKTVTSATATFAATDVGAAIAIGGSTFIIAAVVDAQTITLNRPIETPSATGVTWRFMILFYADVDGSKTGDIGEVQLSAYTTDDKTAPANAYLLVATTRRNLAWENWYFVQGLQGGINCSGLGAGMWSFRRCKWNGLRQAGNYQILVTTQAGVAWGLLVENCTLMAIQGRHTFITGTRHTADYDVGVVWRNCVLLGTSLGFGSTGSGTGLPGGMIVDSCTFFSFGSASTAVNVADANCSTAIPVKVQNSLIVANTGLIATVTGQIVEDYNVIIAPTPRTLVSAGAHSQTNYAGLVEFGQSPLSPGMPPRPLFEPSDGSPILGFGAAAGGPTVDFLGATRPAGGKSAAYAAGAMERANTLVQETTTVDSGSSGGRFDGPGYQDIDVAVDPVLTTITVRARFDATYAGTKPSLLVRNGGEIGVPDASATMVSAADTWETLSLSFTPNRAGIVTIRLRSYDTNGAGKAFFDTIGTA